MAINDLTNPDNLLYLLKYDTVYDRFEKPVKLSGSYLTLYGKKAKILAEKDPGKLPWEKMKIDIVVESTGFFTHRKDARKHIKAGANKVLISALSPDPDITIVLGVNHQSYDPSKHHIVANGSCTTNCAAPVAKILHDNFGILKIQMLTVHAVTSTQSLVDGPNRKNNRRGRAAFASIIPQPTGAATSVLQVIPELKGKLRASAFRVPVLCGSVLEVVAQVEKETSAEEVNKVFKRSASGKYRGIVGYSEDDLVSSDTVGTTYSAIIDAPLTEVINLEGPDENLVKVVAWYDNEWGYSCRLVDACRLVGGSKR